MGIDSLRDILALLSEIPLAEQLRSIKGLGPIFIAAMLGKLARILIGIVQRGERFYAEKAAFTLAQAA